MDLSTLKKGDKISISDGSKEPPLRHNKKHSAWKDKNKTCYFQENLPQYGQIQICDNMPSENSRMNVFWAVGVSNLTIEKIN